MIEEDAKTLWCGNLPELVTEELLYELFLQAGPLEKVRIPKDRDGRQKNFAFITFCHDVSVPYALNLFRGTSLFHRTLTLQSRARMPMLPPPIRCYGPEPVMEFPPQNNFAKQFVDMTENLKEDDMRTVNMARQGDKPDRLVIASLQGNWQHRHHPYRPKEKMHRDDYRQRDDDYRQRDDDYRQRDDEYRQRDREPRERESHNDNYKGNNRNKHSNNWRDRRNHKKGSYHR